MNTKRLKQLADHIEGLEITPFNHAIPVHLAIPDRLNQFNMSDFTLRLRRARVRRRPCRRDVRSGG